MSTMTASPSACAARPRPASRSGQVRLTRRGRLVVFAFALTVVLALAVLWGQPTIATERPQETRTITVAPGETLWGIAAEVAEPGETRSMVEQIRRLNDLDSAMVLSGQRLKVPVTD
jgi:predicted Zn-dependent protease